MCLTLCDPIDGSPPGSPIPRILLARTLEWVDISFSNTWKWKVNYVIIKKKKKSKSPESTTVWLFLLHVSSLALSFGICLNFFYQSFKAYLLLLLLFKHLLQSMKNASTFVSIMSNDYKSLKCITLYWIIHLLIYLTDHIICFIKSKSRSLCHFNCSSWNIWTVSLLLYSNDLAQFAFHVVTA